MNKSDRIDYGTLLRDAYRTVEQLQARIEKLDRAKTEPIAIVGVGCRVPGGANDPAAFWEILRNGIDAVTEIPPDRWDASQYFSSDPDAIGMMSTRWGGFLDRVAEFDAQFFGISPREATNMDPQQRLLLEVAWEALEHAGIAPESLMGSQTGVFVGISTADYSEIQTKSGDPDVYTAYLATGNSHSVASGRLAYVLGLHGPTFSMDTACSSSLIAVYQACQALRNGTCSAALAGAVNLVLIPEATVTLSKAQMMAADGRCKTFSDNADGFVRGEGCGVLVLKRLSDATAAGDRVLALIRGGAINQDGRSNGLTAPNGLAQVALIRSALADARLAPSEVSYIEAHGTGTPLGDPIEVHAIAEALCVGRPADNRLRIGSVKTNLGHLEAASGMAGLIKVVLALQHRQLPAHLHLRRPNPQIAWRELPIDIPTTLTEWSAVEGRRIAGVSSFGFSGSNAHIILEEAPPVVSPDIKVGRSMHLLTLSARTAPALADLVDRYIRYFEQQPEAPLADVCFTAGTGRSHFSHRLSVAASSTDDARQKLLASLSGNPVSGVSRGLVRRTERAEIAFLFTGQGAQYAGMGKELQDSSPVFREAFDRCATLFNRHLDCSLESVLYGDNHLLIDDTAYAQPALFAIGYALAELWRSWGIEPTIVVGHSIGEYTAACVAGVMSLDDATTLVAARGRLMQALPRGGAMVSLTASQAEVESVIARTGAKQVSIAAINAPKSVVVSGAADAVDAVVSSLVASGVRAQRLTVSHAFHSPAIEPMLDAFMDMARTIQYAKPRVAWISTMTGEPVTEALDITYWARQSRSPVRFADAVSSLHTRGIDLAVEIGPTPTLIGLARESGVNAPGWVASLRKGHGNWETMCLALGTLYVNGAAIDWKQRDKDQAKQRLALPTYPFQRQRFWYETPRVTLTKMPGKLTHRPGGNSSSLLGARVRSALPEIQFESTVSRTKPAYLGDHVVHGITLFPATGYAEMALQAAIQGLGWREPALEEVGHLEPLVLPDEGGRLLQFVLSPPENERAAFRILSLPTGSNTWTLHATGMIRETRVEPRATILTMDVIRAACVQEMSISAYYERLRSQGLEYGPRFRGITALSRGDRQALGHVTIADPGLEDKTAFMVHPALLDSCMQVLGAALQQNSRTVDDEQTYLPIGFDRLELREPGAKELWSHASIRPAPENAELLVADIAFFDPAERPAGCLNGLMLKRASAGMLQRAAQQREINDWFYDENWEPKPLKDSSPRVDNAIRLSGSWLVLALDGKSGAALAEILRNRGAQVMVANPGGEWKRQADDMIFDPGDPKHFDRLLAEITPGHTLRGVVHVSRAKGGATDFDPLDCRSALYLSQALGRMQDNRSFRAWIVTIGAQAISAYTHPQTISQAPLIGLARSLALEQPALGWTRIDLDQDSGDEENSIGLADELLMTDDEGEVAFRRGIRLVRRLVRATPPSIELKSSQIRGDATYLITGGLGALGLIMAKWLVQSGARNLVLAGRSVASAKAAATITELIQEGVKIRVVQSDVADDRQVKALFDDLKQTMPRLAGVIHSAGIIEDGLTGQLTWSAFERVFAPKILGARNLHLATQGLQLDFFVLFSSAASFFGSPGQANYAAANAFLDALARHRHALGLSALSINWGAWEGDGMASRIDDVHRRRWFRVGAAPMKVKAATAALARMLVGARPQIAIIPIDWQAHQNAGDQHPARSFFASFVNGQSSGTTPQSRKMPLKTLFTLSIDERVPHVTSNVAELVAKVLGLSAGTLDREQRLTDLGMDSLMAMELANLIKAELGMNIAMARLIQGPTITELIRMLIELPDPELPNDGSAHPVTEEIEEGSL